MDAMEKHDIASIDIPGSFTQADMDEEVVHCACMKKWQNC